ncbi:Chaperone protein DnaK [Stutzerimonas stutzeri]
MAGRPFEEVVLGRPVFFVDDDPQADREAAQMLAAAAHKIGFRDVSFQYEPIAAAFDYESRIEREERVLIVDIGGGTSDFSLVRLSPERRAVDDRQADILATGGVHIGGTDFDKQLSLHGVMPLFGYGSRMKSDAPMPTSTHLNLATWHTINAVYAPASQRALQSMRYDIADPTGIDRLFRLIERACRNCISSRARACSQVGGDGHCLVADRAGQPASRIDSRWGSSTRAFSEWSSLSMPKASNSCSM